MQLSYKNPHKKRKSTSKTTAGKAIPIKQYLHDKIKAFASIRLKSMKNLNMSSKGIFFIKQQPRWGGFEQTYKW